MASSEIDLNTTPAAPPPPGVTPDLIHHRDMKPTLIPTIAIALALTCVAVSIRLFTKLHVLRKIGYEDYVLVLAQVMFIIWCILLVVQPTHGADVWNTSLADYVKFAYWSNLIIVMYVPDVLLAKWAILLQLQRVFTVQPRDGTWWTVRVLIWMSSIFYVTVGFIDVFQCNPREKIWNPTVPGHCFDINGILIGTSVFNVLMNCSILVLPLVVMSKVQMQRKKKVIVCSIFGVASLAAVSSVMRTVYSVLFMHSSNLTRDIFPVAMWAVAEIACIILATTFPTMPRFFEYVRAGFDVNRMNQPSSPTASKRKSELVAGSAGRGATSGRKSWFQLTAIGDEEKTVANESETDITAEPERKFSQPYSASSSGPPSRGGTGDRSGGLGGIVKTVEVEVTSAV